MTTDAALVKLQSELDAMLDPLDIPRSWTARELNAYEARRATLSRRIRAARECSMTIAELDPQIAPLATWLDHLREWHTALTKRLIALPAVARTSLELAERQKLQFSLTRIEKGLDLGPNGDCHYARLPLDDLMREEGYVPRDLVARSNGDAWFGAMPHVKARLAQLQQRRDAAQAGLDDALMDDAERERLALERAQLARETPTRKTRGDGTKFDKYPDGRIVEVTT